ncbi:MAG: NAD(P)H-dependent oxidoreductase [Bacilli bacterium]|nr:NAD(P)H-dependent oxidoreductase [Bacilli bacterium]
MEKTLVAYFSASGVTKTVAEKISKAVEGDLFEIEPVEKYTDADLDWMDKNSRSTIEMNDRSFRPPVKNKVENLEDYQKVVIGFPVWWYTAPTIINTFIEENDLTGKEIYVFCTSGSSGVDGSLNDLKKTYSNLNFISGKRLTTSIDEGEISGWIK